MYDKRDTCCYVVSVWRDFLFLWVLGMGYVILLWHSLSLHYNYFDFDIVSFPLLDGDVPRRPSYGV